MNTELQTSLLIILNPDPRINNIIKKIQKLREKLLNYLAESKSDEIAYMVFFMFTMETLVSNEPEFPNLFFKTMKKVFKS